MLKLITDFISGLNNIGVGNNEDPMRRFYCSYCCDTRNINLCLSHNRDKRYVQPGSGLLYPEFIFQPRPTSVIHTFTALVQLADRPREKVYARYVKSVAADITGNPDAAAASQSPQPPQAESRTSQAGGSDNAGHYANRSYLTHTLQGIDLAVNRVVNAMLPWHQTQAQEMASNISVSPLTELTNTPDVAGTEANITTTEQPDEAAECASWCIHYRDDNQTLFAQQMKTFLAHTEIEMSDARQQVLTELLAGREILFFYSAVSNSSRPRRRLDTEATRGWIEYDIEMHDKAVDKNSTGWKIISWGNKQMEKALVMFYIGLEEKDPRWFAAGGGMTLLGYFSSLVGEIWSGTLFDRQPGETRQEQLMRLGMNMAQLPEAKADSAFNAKSGAAQGGGGWRPRGTMDWPPGPGHSARRPGVQEDTGGQPGLRWGEAEGVSSLKPRREPPGTLLTHQQSGITLQSILQTENDGQRWHLFPQSSYGGTALPVGATPVGSHAAVRNPVTLQWRIEGVAGEHSFTHSSQPNFYLKSARQYYPVKFSPGDGTLTLADGQKVYFHEPSQQWKPYYPGNNHLHGKCLSVIPEESISTAPGQHHILVSVSGLEKRVWSTQDGLHHLEVRSQATNPNSETIGYVQGRLEAEFFTLKTEADSAPWQQATLQWRPATQKWEVATSPFRLLSVLEREIQRDWLHQHPDPGGLAAAYYGPGLYRHGGDYFLRWHTDKKGETYYLSVVPGRHETEFLLTEPGSEPIRLSYDEEQNEWSTRVLSLEAFGDVPESARIEPVPPLTLQEIVPGYEYLYLRGRELFLHIGNGKYGTPEYIRVEQDAQDSEVLRLRIADEAAGTEEHWLFRYDDDEEFVFDEKQQCKRVKRADEEPCASTSTAAPRAKKRRGYWELSSSDLEWLNQHPRETGEMLFPGDSRYERRQKSLHYAARLSLLAPKAMPLKHIAQRAEVDILSIRAWLKKTAKQAKEWLALHPQEPGESGIDYARRLSQFEQPGVSITDISQHTGIRESSIQVWLKALPYDSSQWLREHPRFEDEASMDYALRLARDANIGATLGLIASHAGVSELILKQKIKGVTIAQQQWLQAHPQYLEEPKLDYALRLCLQENSLGLTYAAIASHAGVHDGSMRSRLYRLPEGTIEWLRGVRRQENEGIMDYAMRLYEMSDERRSAGKLKFADIAVYAGVSRYKLQMRIKKAREVWFGGAPRQGKETIDDYQDEYVIQRKNQMYARRLLALRDQQKIGWLIGDGDIALHCGLTYDTLAKLLDPAVSAVQQQSVLAVQMEGSWQPVEGLLHLDVKKNTPLLVDARDAQRSVTHEVLKEPLWISDIKQIEKTLHQPVGETFLRQAETLIRADGARQEEFFDEYVEVYYDIDKPELGLHLIAKQPIPESTFFAFYNGVWHPDMASLKAECRKIGSQRVLKYLWGAKKGPQTISGFQNANKLALVNTADIPGYPSLGQNNVGVAYVNDLMPFYYALKDIEAGEQLLVSYGDYYIPDYFMQTTLNNDIIKHIAAKEQKYFLVLDLEGHPAHAFGPDGVIDVGIIRKQAERFTLRERKDARGIIRYDAVGKSGKRLIAKGRDDDDNLYHAIVKAIHPLYGHDKMQEAIKEMKQGVADVYAREESGVKTEPAGER